MRGGDAGRRGAASWTAIRRGRAGSTCWRSTCWAWPAARRSSPDALYAEVRRAAPYAALARAGFRRRAGASSRTAATRWPPTSAGASCSATPRAACMCARARVAAPAPHEHRHHRRGADAEGAAGRHAAVGPVLGEVEEYFVNLLRPGDTFMFAGRLLRFLRLRETAVEVRRGRRRRADGAGLCRRPAAADHQPRRPRARAAAGPGAVGARFPSRCGMAAAATRALAPARAQRPAGGDVPARRPLVPGGLLLRGPQRAPDARHAADAADGARRLRAAGLRRHRLRAGDLVAPSRRATSRSCSTRTCWATTWKRGWRKARCCGGPSATSR